jgi:hypothetical protein
VDGALVRPGKHFALRVRGDSMKNAGIFDGDVVIVRHETPAGEIAVVVIGEEATVKRYFPWRDKILLLPENEDYEPIGVGDAGGGEGDWCVSEARVKLRLERCFQPRAPTPCSLECAARPPSLVRYSEIARVITYLPYKQVATRTLKCMAPAQQ